MNIKPKNRPAKLFCGLIGHLFEESIIRLAEKFGRVESRAGAIRFDYTDYYNDEFGDNLLRDWVVFEKLINEDDIAKIKLITYNIEKDFAVDGKRTVNIDPGYVNLSKVVLASTKDYSHRIYIGKEIFAEITLIYKHGRFTTLPWTYPDYADNIDFFERVRSIFYNQIRS